MDGMRASDGRVLPRRHRFTLDDALAMVRAGILPETGRIELIDGDLIDMAPTGPEHAQVSTDLTSVIVLACAGKATVRVQLPIRLGPEDAPEPDFAIVRSQDYRKRHPGPEDTLLVIEVSDTSLRYDRTTKLRLYAGAGMPECWIVDVKAGVLDAYRRPGPDGYAETARHTRGDRLALDAAPDIVVPLEFVSAA